MLLIRCFAVTVRDALLLCTTANALNADVQNVLIFSKLLRNSLREIA